MGVTPSGKTPIPMRGRISTQEQMPNISSGHKLIFNTGKRARAAENWPSGVRFHEPIHMVYRGHESRTLSATEYEKLLGFREDWSNPGDQYAHVET